MDYLRHRYPTLPPAARHLLAAAIMLAMLAIARSFPPAKAGYAYLTFYPGIALAILLCGIRPGVLAVAVSAPLYVYIFFHPAGIADEQVFSLPTAAGFVLSAVTILGTIHVVRGRLKNEIARHRQKERDSAETTLRLAGIIDSAMDAIISIDAEQRIILFNPAAERVFGYSAGEMLGSPLERLIPQRFHALHAKHLQHFAQRPEASRKTPLIDKLYGQRRDGSEFPMEAALSRCVVAGKQIFTVILRDISERRQAELALLNSRRQLATMIEQAPLSIAMLDRNMNYLATSRRWLASYGHGLADLSGRNHYELYPNLPEEWKRAHREALAGRPARNDHDLWTKADGSQHWSRWAVHPWIDEAGKVGGIIIATEDITHEMTIEMALRTSEQDLVRAQAVGGIGSWRVDLRTGKQTWSAESYRIFGIPEGTTVNYEVFLSRVHPEDREFVDRLCRALDGEPYAFEHRLLVNGVVKWVRIKAELEVDAAGRRIGRFGITQDITERRLMENQLKDAHDKLAALAAEQAAHLRELSDDLTKAEQGERDRLYELLHDHVQPLLVGARLALVGLNETTPQAAALSVVANVNEQITQTIQAVRTLSVELSPPLIRERGLIPAMEFLCRWLEMTYGLIVDMDYTPGTEPASMTTRLLCFKAVRELLMNVVKYAGTQQAVVDLESLPGDKLRITVRDNGAGFDPRKNQNGSGLANIERRLGMIGGTLAIVSSPGAGTVAKLVIPLEMEEKPDCCEVQ